MTTTTAAKQTRQLTPHEVAALTREQLLALVPTWHVRPEMTDDELRAVAAREVWVLA
jgi:hypothetical protein